MELTAFETMRASQGTAATTALTEAQDVENIRPRIGLAILNSWDDIENKYRRLDAPARRAIAREWGVIYVSRSGEARRSAWTRHRRRGRPARAAAQNLGRRQQIDALARGRTPSHHSQLMNPKRI